MTDASALERGLCGLTAYVDDDQIWPQVELTSHSLANLLRTNDGPGDFTPVSQSYKLTPPIRFS
jgi:hypothetical protein